MGIKTFRPVTPSLRATTALTNDEITKSANKIMQICDDLSNG